MVVVVVEVVVAGTVVVAAVGGTVPACVVVEARSIAAAGQSVTLQPFTAMTLWVGLTGRPP